MKKYPGTNSSPCAPLRENSVLAEIWCRVWEGETRLVLKTLHRVLTRGSVQPDVRVRHISASALQCDLQMSLGNNENYMKIQINN